MTFRLSKKQFEALQARRAGRTAEVAKPKPRKGTARKPARPVGRVPVPDAPNLAEQIARIPGAGRSWTLLMPYGELLNSNDRRHHMAHNRVAQRLRGEATLLARAQRLPRLERAHLFYVLHPDTVVREREPGNWAPTVKACLDGLVDAGVLPDDNSDHLEGPFPMMGPAVDAPGGRMSLVLVEVADLHRPAADATVTSGS